MYVNHKNPVACNSEHSFSSWVRAMISPGSFCAVLAMPGEHCKGSWPKWSHSALFPHCSPRSASPGMFSWRWQRAAAGEPNPTSPFQVCVLLLTSVPQKQAPCPSTERKGTSDINGKRGAYKEGWRIGALNAINPPAHAWCCLEVVLVCQWRGKGRSGRDPKLGSIRIKCF